MGKTYRLKFIKKEKVAKDTYTFYFKRGKFLDFIPGQYVRLEIPHKADDRGTTRYFTISSSPLNKKFLTITTRIIKSTFKKALLNLEEGAKLNAFGPMGWFLLSKDELFDKVFIAGGIGVTPFHSLLTTLAEEKLVNSITLIVSFSAEEYSVFHDELIEVANKNPQITIIYTFAKIVKETIIKYITDHRKPVYYVVGSEDMVASVKKVLSGLKVDEEKIQTEDFTGY